MHSSQVRKLIRPKNQQINALIGLVLGVLALAMLLLWRQVFPISDWAVVFLLLLAVLVLFASFDASAAMYRAQIQVAVRIDSPYASLLTGGLRAFLSSCALTAVATILLAASAVTSTSIEFIVICVIILLSQLVLIKVETALRRHLTMPFARMASLWVTTALCGLVSVPLVAWLNWSITPIPAEIEHMTLMATLQLSTDSLPDRRGWVSEVLGFFYALDYLKLWLVVHSKSQKLIGILFCVDAALITLVSARTGAVLMSSAGLLRRFPDAK